MRKLLFVTCLLVFGSALHVSGQISTFKALFLYNFTQNIEWPGPAAGNGDFVITVVGDSEMAAELEKLAKVRKVGTRKMLVRKVNNVDEVGDTHIVFLAASKSSLMPMLDSYQKGKSVLIVADKAGLCRQGAGIAFTTIDGKLRYEICTSHIEAHGLKVSHKLITLGKKVQ